MLIIVIIDSSRPPSSSIPSVDSSKPISNVNMTIPNQLGLNLNNTTSVREKSCSNSNTNTHSQIHSKNTDIQNGYLLCYIHFILY